MGKKHKHADAIIAWADGATIQYQERDGKWIDATAPQWHWDFPLRIKPEPREWWIVRPRNEWTQVLPAPPMAVHDDTEVIHVREVLP